MSRIKRLAFFGGSFNPIHNGHVFVAKEALKTFAFDALWLVPTANPPHKTLHFSSAARLEMAKLAAKEIAKDNDWGSKIQVSDIEVQAEARGTPVYSFDTLSALKQKHPETEIFFLLGEDAFDYLPKWHRFTEVLQLCSFLVLTREDWAKTQAVRPYQKTLTLLEDQALVKKGTVPLFANACEQSFDTLGKKQILIWKIKTPEISATQVREKLSKAEPVDTLVPASVADYLKRLSPYANS